MPVATNSLANIHSSNRTLVVTAERRVPRRAHKSKENTELTPGRCLVVEDAVAGVQAAKAGGMKCLAVRFVGHHPAEKLQAAGADLVVPSLAEVSVETVHRLLQA